MSKIVCCPKFTNSNKYCSGFCIRLPCVADKIAHQKVDQKIQDALVTVRDFLEEIKRITERVPQGISYEFAGMNLEQLEKTIQDVDILSKTCMTSPETEGYHFFEKNGKYGVIESEEDLKEISLEPAVKESPLQEVKENHDFPPLSANPPSVKKPANSFKDVAASDEFKEAKGKPKKNRKNLHHYPICRFTPQFPIKGCKDGKNCKNETCECNHSCINGYRCKYENCKFFHESEADFAYAACSFGDKCYKKDIDECVFIHPHENATVYSEKCPECQNGNFCSCEPEVQEFAIMPATPW